MVQDKLIKTEKRIRSKIRGKPLDATREHYLRNNISCQSPLCRNNCANKGSKGTIINSLPEVADHYVVPYFDVLHKYLEILEISEICGIIFLQSLVTKISRDISKKHYDRILKKIRNTQYGCIIFLNELHEDTYIGRHYGQSQEEWFKKITFKAIEWYSIHLNKEISLVLLSEDPELALKYEDTNVDIEVLPVESYLKKYWPNITLALELYESITSSLETTQEQDNTKSFEPYLSSDALTTGIKAGIYFKGNLKVNKHHAQDEAFVICSIEPGKEPVDVLIVGQKCRNRAVHLDEVVIKLLHRNEWQHKIDAQYRIEKENDASSTEMPTGKVVGILSRRWRDYVATLPDDEDYGSAARNRDKILVIPYNYCIPKIRICTKQAEKLKNQRIIVRIDNWEIDSQYPNGHFVKILGELGQLKTEVATILVEYEISTEPFSKYLLSELSTLSENSWKVEEKEVNRRKDLRDSHLIFSIDPQGCEDVDDALSIRELPNDLIELGVHIADVSYFVRPFTHIDQEAQIRSTSVYLPDKRFDMLPSILSGNICSLQGGMDRYAVSVIWQLDSECSVKDVWFGRTVICSSFKLTYEVAQSILQKKSNEFLKGLIPELDHLQPEMLVKKISALKKSVLQLTNISRTLKRKRFETGALELDTVDPQFQFDNSPGSNYIKEVKPKQELEMYKVVAECMIFANNWVAKKILETFPSQAVIRRHPPPRESDLKQLKNLAKIKNIDIPVQSNKDLSYCLELAQDLKHPCVSQVMRMATVRGMNQAIYIISSSYQPNDYYHYGLGLDRYTHFTSPIRRYADILVHRLLLAAVGEENVEDLLVHKNMNEICDHINNKHRASQDCGKYVKELYQSFYFLNSENKDIMMDAIIYATYSNGVLVWVPQYALNGSLCLVNKEQQVLVNSDDCIKWVEGTLEMFDTEVVVKAAHYSQNYKLLEHITVKVKVQQSRTHGLHIVFDLADQKPEETCSAIFTSNQIGTVSAQVSNKECYRHVDQQNNEISKDQVNKSKQVKLAQNNKNLYELIRHLKKLSMSVPVDCKIT